MNDHGRTWAAGLRALIVRRLREHGPQTTHELANAIQVSPDAVAPRMSELLALGEAFDTGGRRSAVSGKGRKLKVWAADPPAVLARAFGEEEPEVMRLLE